MNTAEYEQLYKKLYMPLGMYALRFTEDVDSAEDIVQQAFSEIWARISDGAEISDIKAYLYRSVRNAAIAATNANTQNLSADISLAENVSEEDIDTSERDATLWRAIDNLPPRCREIFLMSKRDGYSHAEIAEELGISTKTVENQITKAFSALRGDPRLLTGNIFFLPFL